MDKRIHLYIDNELDEQAKKAFEEELLENKQLYNDYTTMRNLLELVGEQYKQVSAPDGITDKVIKNITAKENFLSFKKVSALAASIIILVLIGTGVYMYYNRGNNLVKITFNVSLPQVKKVYLLGTFNKWGEEPEELKNIGNGLFTLTLKLKPGIYQYVYKLDNNKIIPDPNARLYTKDGFGQTNAILIVKGKPNS